MTKENTDIEELSNKIAKEMQTAQSNDGASILEKLPSMGAIIKGGLTVTGAAAILYAIGKTASNAAKQVSGLTPQEFDAGLQNNAQSGLALVDLEQLFKIPLTSATTDQAVNYGNILEENTKISRNLKGQPEVDSDIPQQTWTGSEQSGNILSETNTPYNDKDNLVKEVNDINYHDITAADLTPSISPSGEPTLEPTEKPPRYTRRPTPAPTPEQPTLYPSYVDNHPDHLKPTSPPNSDNNELKDWEIGLIAAGVSLAAICGVAASCAKGEDPCTKISQAKADKATSRQNDGGFQL